MIFRMVCRVNLDTDTEERSGQIFLQFCHNPHVWQTDRQKNSYC